MLHVSFVVGVNISDNERRSHFSWGGWIQGDFNSREFGGRFTLMGLVNHGIVVEVSYVVCGGRETHVLPEHQNWNDLKVT